MRRWKRKRAGVPCIVWFEDGGGTQRGELDDVSSGGARIRGLADTSGVPALLVLLFEGRTTVQRRCEVVWRASDAIGVRFLHAAKPIGAVELARMLSGRSG